MKRVANENIITKIVRFVDENLFFNHKIIEENVFTAYFNGVDKYSYIEEGHHKPYSKRKTYDSKCHMFMAYDIFDFTKAIVDYLGFDNYYEYPYKDDYVVNDSINQLLDSNNNALFLVNHYVEVTIETLDVTRTMHFEIDGVFRFSVESHMYNRFTSTFVFESLFSWLVKYFTILYTDNDLYKEVVEARKEDNLVYAIKNAYKIDTDKPNSDNKEINE